MVTEVGIFAIFAGYISTKLITPPEESPVERKAGTSAELLTEIRARMDERNRLDAEIESRLQALEEMLAGPTEELDPEKVEPR